jgi:murein DD-endopeptidase MepM/ murein hydrolase activator NlpD
VFLDQVFQSLGSVIFLPYNGVGAILLFIILLYSRWLFLGILSALGLSWGVHSIIYPVGLNGIMPLGYWNWSHFNFALIGASLGGVFFIPSLASLSILFSSFWACLVSYYGLLYFFQFRVEAIHSFPLCFGTMVGVYLAQKVNVQALNQGMIRPLEKALDHLRLRKKRFGEAQCILDLPLRDPSKILQGFEGQWTHQGKWKYALDFICVDESGKSFFDSGEQASDYFIYGKSVTAPIAGWVVRVEDQWDDCAIGKISFRGNWGNWILLKSPYGFYVLLAHLKRRSFSVKEGAYVEIGQLLAQVGNSGYSPEPHLHVQVQAGAEVNSETLPFLLRSYSEADGGIQFYQTPRMGNAILPIRSNQTLQWALNFKADQELCFERNGKTFTLRSGLDPKTGYWYFEELGARGRAYFWKDDREFYFFDWKQVSPDSYLNLFSLGLARIPFALGNQLHWVDSLLTTRLPSCLVSPMERLLNGVLPRHSARRISEIKFQSTADGTEICGNIQTLGKNSYGTQVELDPWVGIRAISLDNERWIRKHSPSPVKESSTLVPLTLNQSFSTFTKE